MSIMNFTVEETNLVAIYKADTQAATLTRIAAALPYMDEDMRAIAEQGAAKLAALTEQKYAALTFAPADEMDE